MPSDFGWPGKADPATSNAGRPGPLTKARPTVSQQVTKTGLLSVSKTGLQEGPFQRGRWKAEAGLLSRLGRLLSVVRPADRSRTKEQHVQA